MKTNHSFVPWGVLLSSAALAIQLTAAPMGTAFTYQGKLTSGGNAANGVFDFSFAVFNDPGAGTQQGAAFATNAVAVTNGYFIVTLDFGNVFPGDARWLDISVKTNGAGSYTALTPRQPLTPAPYAIMADSASNMLGTLPTAQLSGMVGNSQLANNSVTVTAGAGLSGGGTVSLGGVTTLNNAGVLSVTGNADITAAPAAGNVALGSTATDANTANRIVKRDASGDFSAGTVTLAGNLNLPTTTSSAGVITAGGTRLLHAYGSGNSFVGPNAGNFTMSGMANTANGQMALYSNTGGNYNTADGQWALHSNTSGGENTAVGNLALRDNTTGTDNSAVGTQALEYNTNGNYNTAIGYVALLFNTSGSYNVAVGNNAGYNNTSGQYNIALGNNAGRNLTTGNYNIDIGNQGNLGEHQRIRIGNQGTQTNTFIAGIYNTTVSAGTPVYVDSNGQLGSGASSPVALLNANETFTGIVTFSNPSDSFAGNGSALTSLNAGALASGTVADARLSANVALLNTGPTFTGSTLQMLNATPVVKCVIASDTSKWIQMTYNGSLGPMVQGNGYQRLWLDALSTGAGEVMLGSGGDNVGIALDQISGIPSPTARLDVNGSTRVRGIVRIGVETGTSEAPSPVGMVVRRINSTDDSANQIVARTDNLTLERDGTYGGMLIRYPASPGNVTIACMGIDSAGAQKNFYRALSNPGAAGTVSIYTNSQDIVHFECTFGRTFDGGQQLTRVFLSRYDGDYFWMGDVVSTYNQ